MSFVHRQVTASSRLASNLALGLTSRAIRFYASKGLLNPGRGGSNQVYNCRDRARLKLIVRAKRPGFSLRDIAEYLDLYRAHPKQLEQRQLLVAKLIERIAELEQQKIDLVTAPDELYDAERQVIEHPQKEAF